MQSIATFLFVLVASLRTCTAGLPTRFEAARAGLLQTTWRTAGSKEALDAVMAKTTLANAVEVLRKHNQTVAARSRFLGQADKAAVQQISMWTQPQGSDRAKEILTKMIEDTEKKLDAEQNRCTDYDISQMGIIKAIKNEINAFNAASALARSEILEAQGKIDQSETQLPILGRELAKHEAACAQDIGIIQQQLNLALADVNVMDGILKMTTCTSDKIAYPTFLQCIDVATGESFATFRDRVMRQRVAELRVKSVRRAVLESFLQAPHLVNHSSAMALVEMSIGQEGTTSPPPSTGTTTTPPASKAKTQSKCAMSNDENCFILRDRFMQIQGNLVEKVDNLKIVLNHKNSECDKTSQQFEGEIQNFKTQLSSAQTKLASSTTKQNEADAGSRLKNAQLKEQTKAYNKEMKTCNANIGAFQGDMCAINKIRTQVELLKSGKIDPKFQVVDCTVSKWKEEMCSVTCGGGGIQTVRRLVMTPSKNGGAVCPMLERTQACGDDPCPVACVQSEWTEWSACSAACGGGVRGRNRFTQVEALHGGEPCGEKQLTETCGTEACDADCDLSMWTDWSVCSKQCDSGTSTRTRSIDVPAKGEGTCAHRMSDERFLVRPCNAQQCVAQNETLQCNNTKIDVVIVLDASGSLKQEGWDATKSWAKRLVKGFEPANASLSIMSFSGAKSYSTSKKCAANPAEFDIEKDCGIVWLHHWTNDQQALLDSIDNAVWTRSFTLMSLALGSAQSEFTSGRKGANSVAIVVTDGRPMSKEKTEFAAKSLRKRARLVFVPVTSYAPIADLKKWCSYPPRENVVSVANWATLEMPQSVSSVIANVCPNVI